MKPIIINATVAMDLTAKQGDKSARPTFAITAYNGDRMRPGGYYGDVVIDMKGLTFNPSIPILLDHDPTQIVGMASNITVKDGALKMTGVVTGDHETAGDPAHKVVSHARGGFGWGASVGVAPTKIERIDAGQTGKANGKEHVGPVSIVRAGRLGETSFVAIGADSTASATVFAKGRIGMDFEAWLKAEGWDAATLTAKQRDTLMASYLSTGNGGGNTATVDRDEDRVPRITACMRKWMQDRPEQHAEIVAAAELAIESSGTSDDFEKAMVRGMRANPAIGAPRSRASRRFETHHQKPEDVLAAQVLIRMGRGELAAKAYGERTAQIAEDAGCRTTMDIVANAVRMTSDSMPRGDSSLIRAAFSTLELPTALGNAANKIALAAWGASASTWREVAKIESVANFKQHTKIMPNWLGSFQTVGNGGELKHGSASESTYTVQASTSGVIYGITRQNIIDDDLSLFDSLSEGIGIFGAESVNDAFWTLVLSNPSSYYSVGHANLATGATSIVGMDSLTAAIQKMRKQTNLNGKPLPIQPAVLVVPPEYEFVARALLASTLIARDTSSTDNLSTGNPLPSNLRLIVEPRLSNSSFTGYSLTAWYLFAQPAAGAFSVAFLNGQQNPIIETGPADFNTLGIQLRGYLDSGVAAGDYKCSVKSTGVAP